MSHVPAASVLLLAAARRVERRGSDRAAHAIAEVALRRIGARELAAILAGEDRRDVEQLLAVSA